MSDLFLSRVADGSVLTPNGTSHPSEGNQMKSQPSSSLWIERLYGTPEKQGNTVVTHSASKSPLVSSKDLIRAAFASRIVQRDVTASKTLYLRSPDDDMGVQTMFPVTHVGKDINMCNDFIRSAFSSKAVQSTTSTETSFDDYILNKISEGVEDSSAFSDGDEQRNKVVENQDIKTQRSSSSIDDSVADISISDEHLSKLNECVEAIMALTSHGDHRSAEIQLIVDEALNSGVPQNLLEKVIYGLTEDDYDLNQGTPQHHIHTTATPSNPFPPLIRLAYASSVKAYIDDINKNNLSHNFVVDAENGNYASKTQVTRESLVSATPLTDDEDNDYTSYAAPSNADDLLIDETVVSIQSELLQRAIDLMQKECSKSDMDDLYAEVRDHNLDVSLFELLFDVYQQHGKSESNVDALLPVFMKRAISIAQEGQQSDHPMSLLLTAALKCGLPTDAIRRRYLKEKKRYLEKLILDGNMSPNALDIPSLLGQENITIDDFQSHSKISLTQDDESHAQVNPEIFSAVGDTPCDESTPRKHHVAEFHTIENGDADFILMEDDDVEVAFFDESEEVRIIDESREDSRRKLQNQVLSQNQEKGYESSGLRSMAAVGITKVHAVSAAVALKLRHYVKKIPSETKRINPNQWNTLFENYEGIDITLFQDATRIVRTSTLSEEGTWNSPDVHKNLIEQRCFESRTWIGFFSLHNMNLIERDNFESGVSSSVLEEIATVPCPQTFEIALLQLTQKNSNPTVGKILVDMINTKDRASNFSGRICISLFGHEVEKSFPTMGRIISQKCALKN